MFRQFTPAIRSVLVNESSIYQQFQSQYATIPDDKKALHEWYQKFRPEDITSKTRDQAKVDRTKSKVTIQYPLDSLPKSIPRKIHDKIRMSMYAKVIKNSKGTNEFLEISSQIDGSIGEKENDAWNTLHLVMHVAAQSELEGNWHKASKTHLGVKKIEFDSIAKREMEFRVQQSRNLDDVTRRATLQEAARNAHRKSREKQGTNPNSQYFTARGKHYSRGGD